MTTALLKLPATAVLSPLDRQWASVALTRREVERLLVADGYRADVLRSTLADWDAGQTYSTCLNSTGAKVQPASKASRPTRARTFILSGYHYAGTDVSSVVEVAA